MGHIHAMRFGDEAHRERLHLGFKHTVREAWTIRSKVSQPHDDKWKFAPPIVGVLQHSASSATHWVVEEHDRPKDADQFEHHTIRAVG